MKVLTVVHVCVEVLTADSLEVTATTLGGWSHDAELDVAAVRECVRDALGESWSPAPVRVVQDFYGDRHTATQNWWEQLELF